MKIYGNLRGISLMSLLTTVAFATVHCMHSDNLGDGDSGGGLDLGDNLGGGSSTGSANESELIGSASMAASGGDVVNKDDSVINDAGGAGDSGGHQLDSAQTDQGDLGLDPDNVGRDVS